MDLRQVDPSRLTLEAYPLQAAVSTDPATLARDLHIANIALAALYDDARTALVRRIYAPEVRKTGLRPLLVQTTVAYRAEVAHPSSVIVATAAGALGRTSFTLLQAQFVEGRCVGLCDSIFVNFGGSGPEPLVAAHREHLGALAWRGQPQVAG